jgi:phthalate 4,5-cis-dihydrodiol dehydrogenase
MPQSTHLLRPDSSGGHDGGEMAQVEQTAGTSGRRVLRFGIAGLGVGSAMAIPTLERMAETDLVAAADIRPEAQQMFRERYEGRAYDSVQKLCEDPDVDVVWVATPNNMHCEHVVMAAQHGKHVICEKPMALSMEQAELMVETADRNNVKLICGHTYSLNPSVQAMKRVVRSGELGRVIQMANWLYSDWLLKPRMPEELDVDLGGGVVHRHGPHIIDTLRTIGGGLVRSVRANWGAWMPERPAPGNFTAFLEFEDGTPASVSYNGYGYFNTSDLVWGIGDRLYTGEEAVRVRKALRSGEFDVAQAKEQLREATRTGSYEPETQQQGRRPATGNWFGITLVSCERGAIRQSPDGLLIYDDEGQHEVRVNGDGGTGSTELRELYDAITKGAPIAHDGRWGMATLEVILAILQSGRERREIMLSRQCALSE